MRAYRNLALTLFACFFWLSPQPSFAQRCQADCDADGAVAINELIVLVNVALGESPVSACAAGDLNGDGEIAINELISAVNVALGGCPANGGNPAAAGLAVARALAQLPALSDIVAGGLNSIGASETCTFGGTLASSCEDLGDGTFVNQTIADHCRLATPGGVVESTGSATTTVAGQCPNQLVPFDVQMVFDADALLQSNEGVPLIHAHLDATVTLKNLIFGGSRCSLAGGVVTVDGPITYTRPDGRVVTVTFDATDVTFQFVGTDAQCRNIVTAIATGDARIDDTYGNGPLGLSVTLDGLSVTEDRDAHSLAIAGDIVSNCLGGRARLETAEPLAYPLDQACFAGGSLEVGLSSGTVQAIIGADGAVQVDRTGDGAADSSYASCLDLPRAVCE